MQLQTLSVQQLSAAKKQLDDELEHLTVSFARLRGAQTKFHECAKFVRDENVPQLGGMF